MNLSKLLLVSCIAFTSVYAEINRENSWYGYFGWNRAVYADSDISFKGNDHDFTIYDVKANDRQNPWSELFSHYLNPSKLTIPQYNIRIGYYLTNNISISFGQDHMKYVMSHEQTTKISGYLNSSVSKKHQKNKNSINADQELTSDFLNFEHTDGYNLFSLDVDYIDSVYEINNIDISFFAGLGFGLVIPRSDITLGDKKRRDEWHLAGIDASLKVGSEISFGENYFIRTLARVGNSYMFDILTTNDGGKATQNISYAELIWALGYRF